MGWQLSKGIHPLIMLFAALIGQVIAVAAAEIPTAGWKVELCNPPLAGSAVDHQRADEPVSHTAEIAGRSSQFHPVIYFCLLLGVVISLRVLEPHIVSPILTHE